MADVEFSLDPYLVWDGNGSCTSCTQLTKKHGAGQLVRKLSIEENAERRTYHHGAMVGLQLMVLFPGSCTACEPCAN